MVMKTRKHGRLAHDSVCEVRAQEEMAKCYLSACNKDVVKTQEPFEILRKDDHSSLPTGLPAATLPATTLPASVNKIRKGVGGRGMRQKEGEREEACSLKGEDELVSYSFSGP